MLLSEFIYYLCLLKDSSSLRKVCLTTNLVEHFPSALTDKEGHRGENYHISEPAPTRLILDGMGWRGEESRNTDRAAPGLPHAPKSTRRVSSLLSVAPTPRRQSLKNSAMARGVRTQCLTSAASTSALPCEQTSCLSRARAKYRSTARTRKDEVVALPPAPHSSSCNLSRSRSTPQERHHPSSGSRGLFQARATLPQAIREAKALWRDTRDRDHRYPYRAVPQGRSYSRSHQVRP